MSRHLAQSTVANPVDYNRAQIAGLITLMNNMMEAIAIAPENFAVVDLMQLHEAAKNMHYDMMHAPAVRQFIKDWTSQD